jgi:hypothetical protein
MLLTLRRARRVLARLHAEPRDLLPRTRGLVLFRYRGPEKGLVAAVASLAPEAGGATVYRTFRVRL